MTLKNENTVTNADILIVGNGALGLFLQGGLGTWVTSWEGILPRQEC